MRTQTLLVLLLCLLPGCSLGEFGTSETNPGQELSTPVATITLPRDRVFSGTAYDCINYEKRAVLGYKVAEFSTRFGTFATGPLVADNYVGVYGARKTSFWGYWLAAFVGRDTDDGRNTGGVGYLKNF